MTTARVAATAALSISVLLITTTGGEAQRPDTYRAQTGCKTKHTTTRDFAKGRTEVRRLGDRPGDRRPAGVAALVPVEGAKVITKLIDLTLSNGDNVLDRKDVDRTNDNGVAKTKHEFNDFGNYQMKFKVKVDGNVVAEDTIDFGVADRESGKCDPPLAGAASQ
jgi:hypothetical protein